MYHRFSKGEGAGSQNNNWKAGFSLDVQKRKKEGFICLKFKTLILGGGGGCGCVLFESSTLTASKTFFADLTSSF